MKKNKLIGYISDVKATPGKVLYKEKYFGVPPEALNPIYHTHDSFVVHKSAKKGQSSFRITKGLLESLIETSLKIQKQPNLIISIPVGKEEYKLNCTLTKNQVS